LGELKQTGAQCTVWNHYGPTETTVGVLLQSLGKACAIERTGQAVSLGRPLGNNAIAVVDTWQQIVPVGVIGELYIAGEGLARGYLGRARETAERFVPDPYALEAGARMYRTGDLARYGESGELEFIGRADRQVKIRGYRVELGEIEATLRKHERVRDSIVQMCGERLIGYVLSQQPLPEQPELRAWVSAHLPEYMVPAAFVRLLAWPLTANGKIDLRSLPEPEEEKE
jgi:acyl-coenzyme A synthetase/AMP-(fatty) acid ligase